MNTAIKSRAMGAWVKITDRAPPLNKCVSVRAKDLGPVAALARLRSDGVYDSCEFKGTVGAITEWFDPYAAP